MAALRIATSFLLPLLIAAAAAPAALAQSLPPRPFLPLPPFNNIHINGTVPCGVGPMTAATPAFPNARVQLLCGPQVISSTTSNVNGVFEMLVGSGNNPVTTLLNMCMLSVPTPLSFCNPSLPTTGILQSFLKLNPDGIDGGLVNLVAGGFNLLRL